MSRSLLFSQLARTIRMAHYCQEHNISTSIGVERIASLEALRSAQHRSRREFLVHMGKLAVVGATVGVGSGELYRTLAAPNSIDLSSSPD